jgi:hypothetical protein
MKKYHFGYYEFVKNYKFVEIYLDSSVDPQSIADSMLFIDEFITWEESGVITNESEIKFQEIPLEDARIG